MTLIITLLLQNLIFADCKHSAQINDTTYCYEMNWKAADKKIKGELSSTDTMSPVLIPMKEMPQKWFYSKLHIKFWAPNDSNKSGLEVDGLKVLPFMYMDNGHNHSTSHTLNFEQGVYKLSAMALHQMTGCWSINWKINDGKPQLLQLITKYTNLTPAENQAIKKHCQK